MSSLCQVLLLLFALHVLVISAQPTPTNIDVASTPTSAQSPEEPVKVGWTSGPNTRGTLDIVWTWAFTMFLCSWSVLCMNVPGPDDTAAHIFTRKLYLLALGLLGPEFIFQIALGQWVLARQSVRDFRSSGYDQWTLRHAFFANMGGFVLHTRDWVPFPINAKQLHYLVTRKFIPLPDIDERLIKDKNKLDGLLRIITLCQILWFLVDLVGRYAQQLEITCGDLTTAAFIVCTFGTTFCWRYKPADVTLALVIEADISIVEILLDAGDRAQHPYADTPLDFVSRREWAWSLYWSNWVNILRHMGVKFGPHIRPLTKFSNTACPELKGAAQWTFLGVTAVYSAIFICGWDYSFPTPLERTLWRTASTTIMGTLVAYWGVTEFAFVWHPALRRRLAAWRGGSSSGAPDLEKNPRGVRGNSARGKAARGKAQALLAACRNNSVARDPQLAVPLKAILPIYGVAVCYCFARVYLYVADVLQLRALPGSAYRTVEWAEFLPHV